MLSGNEKYRVVVPVNRDTSFLQCMLSPDSRTLVVATPMGYRDSDIEVTLLGQVIGSSSNSGVNSTVYIIPLTLALGSADVIEILVESRSTPTPPESSFYAEMWRVEEASSDDMDTDPPMPEPNEPVEPPVVPVTNNSSVNLSVKVVSINAVNTGAIGNIPNFHNGIYRGAGYIYRG